MTPEQSRDVLKKQQAYADRLRQQARRMQTSPEIARFLEATAPIEYEYGERPGWTPGDPQHFGQWFERPKAQTCPDCGQGLLGNTLTGDHIVMVGGEALTGPCPAA